METLADYASALSILSLVIAGTIFIYTWRQATHQQAEASKAQTKAISALNAAISDMREYNTREHRQLLEENEEQHKEMMAVITELVKVIAVINSDLDKHITSDLLKK